MEPFPLKTLVNKLNPVCKRALEAAAGLCLSRSNYNIEIEHYLLKLIEVADGDVPRILRQFEINQGVTVRELTKSLDRLKTGNARAPEMSIDIVDWLRERGSAFNFQAARIRSGHLLPPPGARNLARRLLDDCPSLRTSNGTLTEHAPLARNQRGAPTSRRPSVPPQHKSGGPAKQSRRSISTMNLTERAKKGEIDPVIGRDFEIRQVIDILTRRRQNNPILTGEAGVGKTAVVEGFALQIVAGDVPPPLKNVAVRTLDLGLLQAGAGVKGEFENRLKQVIQEVKSSPQPIILFIDEAHTMIGAGGQAGQGDAANLLKPALARGERARSRRRRGWSTSIGLTRLKRRFQSSRSRSPIAKAIADGAGGDDGEASQGSYSMKIEESVKLSHRYITDAVAG